MRVNGVLRGDRVLAYAWALPVTVPGLLLALSVLAAGGRARNVAGVLEVHGPAAGLLLRRFVPLRGGASAMTLGHVVLGRDAGCLERTRSHERVHVRQCERWGIFFLPAYAIASLAAALRGRHYYRDNAFEKAAVAVSGPTLRYPSANS